MAAWAWRSVILVLGLEGRGGGGDLTCEDVRFMVCLRRGSVLPE